MVEDSASSPRKRLRKKQSRATFFAAASAKSSGNGGDHLPDQYRFVTIARFRAVDATYQELEADWIKTAKRLNLWSENA